MLISSKKFKVPELLVSYISNIIIQGTNAVIPIIILPIVTRLIGLEKVGMSNFSQSFVLYFTLFINFGFDFLGSRKIAQANNDLERANISSIIISTKIYLFIVSSVAFLMFVLLYNEFQKNFLLHFLSFLINIGFVFHPSWYFIGVGKYNYVLKVSFVIRIVLMTILLLTLYIFENYLIYTFITSVVQILIGLITFNHLRISLRLSFSLKPLKNCLVMLREGFSLFLSSTFINLYTSTSIFLIGFLTNNFLEVGVFSVSYKIISGVNAIIITAFSQTVFSKLSSAIKLDAKKGIELINFLLFPSIIFTSILGILLIVFSRDIASIFSTENIDLSRKILVILSFTPMLIIVSNQLALQGLINLNLDKAVLKNTVIAGIFSIVMNLVFIPKHGAISAAYNILATEILIILLSIYQLAKHGHNINFVQTKFIKNLYHEIFKR